MYILPHCLHYVYICTMYMPACLPAVIVIDGFVILFFFSFSLSISFENLTIFTMAGFKKNSYHTPCSKQKKRQNFFWLAWNDAKACKFAWKCLNLCPCLLIMHSKTIIKILIVHIVYIYIVYFFCCLVACSLEFLWIFFCSVLFCVLFRSRYG